MPALRFLNSVPERLPQRFFAFSAPVKKLQTGQHLVHGRSNHDQRHHRGEETQRAPRMQPYRLRDDQQDTHQTEGPHGDAEQTTIHGMLRHRS